MGEVKSCWDCENPNSYSPVQRVAKEESNDQPKPQPQVTTNNSTSYRTYESTNSSNGTENTNNIPYESTNSSHESKSTYVPETPSPEDEENRFDDNTLTEITGGDDAGLKADIISTFFKSTTDELENLTKALNQNDAHHAEIYSHSIKGAAKYVGASKVAAIAFEIEKMSKAKEVMLAKKRLPSFVKEIGETSKVLEEYRQSLLKSSNV